MHFLCVPLGVRMLWMLTLGMSPHRTLTRQDLVEYISSHYKAPRMVLAAAGGMAALAPLLLPCLWWTLHFTFDTWLLQRFAKFSPFLCLCVCV